MMMLRPGGWRAMSTKILAAVEPASDVGGARELNPLERHQLLGEDSPEGEAARAAFNARIRAEMDAAGGLDAWCHLSREERARLLG